MRKFYATTEYWLTLLVAGYWIFNKLPYTAEVCSGLYLAYLIGRTLFKMNRGLVEYTALSTSELHLLILVQAYVIYVHSIYMPWLILSNHVGYILSRGLSKKIGNKTQLVYHG